MFKTGEMERRNAPFLYVTTHHEHKDRITPVKFEALKGTEEILLSTVRTK